MTRSINFPAWVHVLIIAALVLSIFSANPVLSVFSLSVIIFLTKLLWRKGEPPVLLFIVLIQWMQASTKIFHANFYNFSLEYFSSIKYIQEAIILSLIGILVLGIAMYFSVRGLKHINFISIYEAAGKINVNKLFRLYFLTLIGVLILGYVRSLLPALSQIIFTIQNVKWIVIYILLFTVLIKRTKYHYIFIVMGIELLIGFTSYFAGFKTIFFYLLIAMTTVKYQMRLRSMMPITLALSSMVFFMIVWTSIKTDYRNFMSKGQRAQIIAVSPTEQLNQVSTLVSDLDRKQLTVAIDKTLQRISYVDYFGHSLEYVPKIRDHENGKIWSTALQHIMIPRFLNPSKDVLPSDSELTMEYTGLRLASLAQGSSISIGYMGESYIDFGRFGMFIPIFILGILWGKFYKYFITHSKVKVIGFAFAVAVLINAYQLEMNSTKLLGSMIMQFIVLAILFKIFEVRLYRWLIK